MDRGQSFEHLGKAPIVEAVIELRAAALADWERSRIGAALRDVQSEYPQVSEMGAFTVTAHIGVSDPDTQRPSLTTQHDDQGWLGFQMVSSDGLRIARFTRDFMSLSVLKPYPGWDVLKSETMRLWSLHRSLSGCEQVSRLGVRTINRLDVPSDALVLGAYFRDVHQSGTGLETRGMFHSDELTSPGQPYTVRRIQAVDRSAETKSRRVALLLDLDVFSAEPTATQDSTIEEVLAELHDLKNRVFFSSLTEQALRLCR